MKMPAELGHDWHQRLRRAERNAAPIVQLAVAEKMVEAQSTNAEVSPLSQIARRHIGNRDAAQADGMALERVEHRRIVSPMRAALHQRTTLKPEHVQHVQVFC